VPTKAHLTHGGQSPPYEKFSLDSPNSPVKLKATGVVQMAGPFYNRSSERPTEVCRA
jgi:hypothetical protein